MLLKEFTLLEQDANELMALSQFLMSRAEDTDSEKSISVTAFLELANDLGIPMTKSQLIDQVGQPPLSNLIDNVQGDRVLFKGNTAGDDTMSVSDAEKTVEKMSKRAAGKSQ